MDSQKLKILGIVFLSALFAPYLGIAAATAKFEAIAWVLGVVAIVFFLALGKHIWVLIPISLVITGSINALPGTPPLWWLAMLVVMGMMTLRFVMRTGELRYRFTWLDVAILLQALAVGQAFVRHPAGVALFGSDTVGGKANVNFFFAILCYAILAGVKTDLSVFKRVTLLTIGVAIIDGIVILASGLSPAFAIAVLPLYSGVEFTLDPGALGAAAVDVATGRLGAAKELGQTLGIAALTLFAPMSLINPLKLGRFLMFATAGILVLLSGFRSIIGIFAILFVVGSFVRGRKTDVLIAAMIAMAGISLLLVTGLTRQLPFGAQRVLAVLPIDVDARAKAAGEDSSEWRFEMWRLALGTDRYIHDRILGDGCGFSANTQRAREDAMYGDHRRGGGSLEDFMERGSYHGFHVETIKATGIVGLILALIGMGIFFRTAWKLIQYYRNRPEWMYVLYLCIPFLIHPFYYMLVFGGYKSSFPLMLISAGMLKVLDNIRRDELAAVRIGGAVRQ
jgi:hypothetical protein